MGGDTTLRELINASKAAGFFEVFATPSQLQATPNLLNNLLTATCTCFKLRTRSNTRLSAATAFHVTLYPLS